MCSNQRRITIRNSIRAFFYLSRMEFLDIRDFFILGILKRLDFRLETRRLLGDLIKPMCELCDFKCESKGQNDKRNYQAPKC